MRHYKRTTDGAQNGAKFEQPMFQQRRQLRLPRIFNPTAERVTDSSRLRLMAMMQIFTQSRFGRLRMVVCLSVLMFYVGQCQTQLLRPAYVDITERDTVQQAFLNDDANVIENATYLEPFFQKLQLQRTQGGRKVNVLHIGDSHILGNFLTREVRKRLQYAFGDAGRGLVFPYKLADSNGPKDYLVSAEGRWNGDNCQRSIADIVPIGVSGFQVETFNPKAALTFRMNDTASSEVQTFTKVTIFQRKHESQFDIEVRDDQTNQQAQLVIDGDYSRSYFFDRPVGQVTIVPKKTDKLQKKLTLDGVSIENEYSGVMYHAVGVNGATFEDYTRAKYFSKQVADLYPDLVILSFGTNEAQGSMGKAFLQRTIQTLVDQILEQSPGSQIMLTTPADSYLRGKGFNPYMAETAAAIREFAVKRGYALWDLYNLSGGVNSAQNWKNKGLMSQDSVHYSKTGYAAQGKMLYQSIIKSYNNFVMTKP